MKHNGLLRLKVVVRGDSGTFSGICIKFAFERLSASSSQRSFSRVLESKSEFCSRTFFVRCCSQWGRGDMKPEAPSPGLELRMWGAPVGPSLTCLCLLRWVLRAAGAFGVILTKVLMTARGRVVSPVVSLEEK